MQTTWQKSLKPSGSHNLHRTTVFLVACLLSLCSSSRAQKPDFSLENAFALVRTLAVDIGPRPMGSPAEQRALDFAVKKFAAYGCQESYLMPMTVADGVNTKSGIAVGVLKGKTGRIVVIGGHMDSAGPEVPGANDDASGAACVIELARVLARRHNESTVFFCCWGGEEQGLQGSKYFVEHFAGIDSVVLMMQIDMADGAGRLEIDPDAPDVSAPRWLTEAAYDVFYSELGYSGLVYPTHSATWNLALGGAYGSDHVPFLSKGIPSICFSSDITFPIHTPQDRIENFTPSGLKRSGDLVLRLFERFDAGVPSRSTDRYALLELGTVPVYLPYWMLWGCVVISFVVSIFAFWVSRHHRNPPDDTPPVTWSGLKVLVFVVFVQVFIWYSAPAVGVLRGYRFPWVNNFGAFVLLALLSGLFAAWLVVQITPRLKMSTDQFVYARVAFALFLLMIAVTSLLGPRVAAYPALGLLLFSLAVIVRHPVAKFILMLAAPYPIIRLVFNESLGLIQRVITQSIPDGVSGNAIYALAYVVFFTFLSLPFVYGFAAMYMGTRKGVAWVEKFRSKAGVVLVSVAAVAVLLYILRRPVYDRLWYSTVRVEQQFVLGSDSSKITVKGTDYLNGLRIRIDGKDTLIADHTTFSRLEPHGVSTVPWCVVERETHSGENSNAVDSLSFVERLVRVRSQIRALRVRINYSSSDPFGVSSPWSNSSPSGLRRDSDRNKTFAWYSFPDTALSIPLTFRMHDGQRIAENIEVTYDSLAYPMQMSREFTNITERTIVTANDTLQVQLKSQLASHGITQ